MGNICRSPMASSVMQAGISRRMLAESIAVDSAGTYAGRATEKADARAIEVARAHGYPQIDQERARRVREEDFEQFDLILAMDARNLADLRAACPPEHQHKLHLFLAYAGVEGEQEVPDPYYNNMQVFEDVLGLCELGSDGVLDRVAASLN